MQFPLWRLVEGPEWASSLSAEDPGDGYFWRNVAALRDCMEYDPFAYSEGLAHEHDDTRVFKTKDVAAGYRLVGLVRIDRSNQTVELGWATVEPL
ncbi:MAG: hypothetical protein M3141_03180 [Actinomycetota bacterium]|nr:hypothetical protein [Actinomycetota bacterium]